MKQYFALTLAVFISNLLAAQTDTIFTKGNQQIFCYNIKQTGEEYKFVYTKTNAEKAKSSILKFLVDSIKYATPIVSESKKSKKSRKAKTEESAAIVASTTTGEQETPAQAATPAEPAQTENKVKAWTKTLSIGINLGNVLEFNNPSGTDIKNLSLNTSLDLGLNFKKAGKKFEMTNELHYLFGFQKAGLTSGAPLQRVQDDLNTLHDLSFGIGKTNKWNFNLIMKSNTSLFTIFDGDHFKDVTGLGRIKSFASPYDITVAPGIKFQPNEALRISLSPYSFNLYGVENDEIRNKGIFITDIDAGGNFKNFLFKRLGAEINFWFDKRVKQWLDMQYRLSFSSDYFEKIGKNGIMEGLFITKIKIFKDLYFTHRASINSDFAVNFWKPYYSQTMLLSYSKSF